jgi:hypothetical protein
MRSLLLVLILASVTCAAPALGQPGAGTREGTERDLVVLVRGKIPPQEFGADDTTAVWGSGIILGTRSDSLFVATARHVVRSSAGETASGLVISTPDGATFPATVMDSDSLTDLAVLVAPLGAGWHSSLPFPLSWVGNPDELALRQPLYPVGCPQGNMCGIPAAPSLFGTVWGPFLRFESGNVVEGYSGGGLFTARGELIGMISSVSFPNFTALRIDTLLAHAAGWGAPVEIHATPRDPFSRAVWLSLAGPVFSTESSAPFSASVEYTADWAGPFQHLIALRGEIQEGRSSIGIHAGTGVTLRHGRSVQDLGRRGAISAFLDVGLSLNGGDVPDNDPSADPSSSLGWSTGVSIRWRTRLSGGELVGAFIEGRLMGASLSGSSEDAINLGVSVGLPF